jgi:2-haloacid dehalogenase
MTNIAVFDINETTLDLAPVREVLNDLLGHVGGFTVWFQKLLQLSMTATATDNYVDFSTLASAAFESVADTSEIDVADDGWDRVAGAMGSLDPYPDVVPGLNLMRDHGWTTIALTNSAPASVEAQLKRAGLSELFDQVLSVDAVQAYKPAAAPYLYAADQAGAAPGEMMMVACHDWDLAGARAVGMSTAFVGRPGMSYAPNYPKADVSVNNFVDLAASVMPV